MNLIKLKDEDLKEFKKLMQDAFQYGYESVFRFFFFFCWS